jgi:hypothetical protein
MTDPSTSVESTAVTATTTSIVDHVEAPTATPGHSSGRGGGRSGGRSGGRGYRNHNNKPPSGNNQMIDSVSYSNASRIRNLNCIAFIY